MVVSTLSRAVGVFCLFAVVAVPGLAVAGSGALPFRTQTPLGIGPSPDGQPCNGLTNTTGNPTSWVDPQLVPPQILVYVQKFIPPTLPFRPTAVCFPGFSFGTPAPYDIVIYSDANGRPGTRLALAQAVPEAPGFYPGTWMTTSVDGSVAALNGPFWAGIRTSSVAFRADLEQTDVPPKQYGSLDDGATFVEDPGTTAPIQVVGLSGPAALDRPVPALSGIGLAALAAALAAGGFVLLRRV